MNGIKQGDVVESQQEKLVSTVGGGGVRKGLGDKGQRIKGLSYKKKPAQRGLGPNLMGRTECQFLNFYYFFSYEGNEPNIVDLKQKRPDLGGGGNRTGMSGEVEEQG